MIYNNFNSINIDNKIMIIENKEKKLNNYLLILTVLENGTFSTEIIEKQYLLTYLIENNYIQGFDIDCLKSNKKIYKSILEKITALQYQELLEDNNECKLLIEINNNFYVLDNTEKAFNEILYILN